MVPLYLSVIIEHVPLYLNGSLSYISSRSFRLSPPTLEPLDPILNTASILLSPYSLSPSRALSSRQVLCLLAALDTFLGHNPLVSEYSRSLLSPRQPPHFHHSVTWFYTYSSSLIIFTSSFSYTPPLFPLINHRLMNSIDHRIVRLCRHRDRCLRFLTTRYPILEAAKGSKWYQEYRRAQVRINCLQRQA
jgi:hypothetical protein